MAETVNWSYTFRAQAGPSMASAGVLSVDAYQKLSVAVAAGVTQTVTLAPGTWTDVHSLLITSSDLSGAVTITPDGAAAAMPLDGPLVLVGPGAVSLLGAGNAQIDVENTGAADVTVDVFVTRDATP